jgi:tetratricopeptide (TPR) repeat protein
MRFSDGYLYMKRNHTDSLSLSISHAPSLSLGSVGARVGIMASVISVWRNWRERRDILRDLRRKKAELREWEQYKIRNGLTEALSALERNDHSRANELWTAALDHSPREVHASPLALDVLLGLRRFDEAEAMMREGQTKHPTNIRFAIGLAEVARARGDDESALKRWAAVRKQFPGAMVGYAVGVEALRNLKRLPEAEILAEQTVKRFPDEVLGFMEQARIATMQEDWEQSLSRWDVVRRKFNHSSGYTGAGHALAQLGRFDEAEAMLAQARTRAPTDIGPFIELARCAQANGDIPIAIDRWKRLVSVFPLHLPSCLLAAGTLETLGATADAESILREAVDHFPAEPSPIESLGLLLLRRPDLNAAVEAFATMRNAFPDNRVSYIRQAEALTRAGRTGEAETVRSDERRRFQ